jgi:hypothetical protein
MYILYFIYLNQVTKNILNIICVQMRRLFRFNFLFILKVF